MGRGSFLPGLTADTLFSFIRLSAGFSASSGIIHRFSALYAPGIRPSLQRILILRAEIPHLPEASFVVIHSPTGTPPEQYYNYIIPIIRNKINLLFQKIHRNLLTRPTSRPALHTIPEPPENLHPYNPATDDPPRKSLHTRTGSAESRKVCAYRPSG